MGKKCICGHEMTAREWDKTWVCHRCGRKKPMKNQKTYMAFRCSHCGASLCINVDENLPEKLNELAESLCQNCGAQSEGLWQLLGQTDEFNGDILME